MNSRETRLDQTAARWILRRDAGLTPAEQAEFEHWQTVDPRHVAALARKEKAWSTLDRPLQGGQSELLLARLAARAAQRRRRRLGMMAASVIALCATGIFWPARDHVPTVAVERGLILRPETRVLADGSVIELRPGAEIAVTYSDTVRHVSLVRGEAHFQVAKNPGRPFIVATSGVEFRAVGTAFAVSLAPAQVELVVTEGRVAVERKGASASMSIEAASLPDTASSPNVVPAQMLTTVGAGNRMVVELASARAVATPTTLSTDELAERLAWRAPKLEFSEIELAQAVAMMNEHNRTKLVIDDAELARLPISGVFRADNADTFVRLLEGNFGVHAEYTPGVIRLRKSQP